jgi:hypothetical protein
MKVSALPFGLSCALLVAPAAQAFPYVDLIDYPQQEANWDRFFALEGRLQHGFDAICGDTFCEGEYSDIRALRLRCSVDAVRGTVMSACGHLPPAIWRCPRTMARSWPGNRPGCAACRWCRAPGGGLPCRAGRAQSAA